MPDGVTFFLVCRWKGGMKSRTRLRCRTLFSWVPCSPSETSYQIHGRNEPRCLVGSLEAVPDLPILWSQTHRELNIRLVAGGATGSRSTAQPKAKRYTVPDGTDGSAEERAEEQSHQMQPSKPIFRDIIDSLDDCFRLFDRKVETFRNPPTNA